MAQFFDVDGESPSLTAEQQLLLDRWSALSEREKQLVCDLLELLLEHRA